MTSNVYWMLALTVNEDKLDDLRTLMDDMCSATEANEPDTLFYEWSLNADETVCHIYERFADSDAAMVHLGNFGAHFAERFMSCLTPTGFTVYGQPNQTVKDALAPFGPTYMPQAAGFAR